MPFFPLALCFSPLVGDDDLRIKIGSYLLLVNADQIQLRMVGIPSTTRSSYTT
jgi:hypothetical protein